MGYFVLGPNDLYKLVKELGKFVQNFRTLGAEASKTLETTMESQLELQEIRKAQRELTDAFNFRRTINVDEQSEAFATNPESERKGVSSGATKKGGGVKGESSSSSSSTKKRKKKMKKKKKVAVVEPEQPPPLTEEEDGLFGNPFMDVPPPDLEDESALYPEMLDMPTGGGDETTSLRDERLQRLATGTQPSDEDTTAAAVMDPEQQQMEQDRFAAQMNGSWNQQILDNNDALDPVARVMEKLALLEEEKQAADSRLEEEFTLRTELEEKYYRQKRSLLEDAIAQIQTNAFITDNRNNNNNDQDNSNNTNDESTSESESTDSTTTTTTTTTV